MNIPNLHATATNAQEIAPANATVATTNNEPTLDPVIIAIANGIAVLTQNLSNLTAAVNVTNTNVDHLTAVMEEDLVEELVEDLFRLSCPQVVPKMM